METHYQLLGVHDRADAAAIRVAYLALAKRYHPDVAANKEKGAADLTRINIAYSILRNPAKRAAYDASLAQRRTAPALQAVPKPRAPSRRRYSRRSPGRWLAGLGAGAALLFLLTNVEGLQRPPGAGSYRPEALANAPATPAAATGPARVRIDPRIQDAAAFAAELTLTEATNASRHCFEQRAIYPSLSIADQCIAFDMAFASIHGGSRDAYFAPRTMTRRHLEALTLLVSSEDRSRRLRVIAERANSALRAAATARSDGVLPPVYSAGRFPQ